MIYRLEFEVVRAPASSFIDRHLVSGPRWLCGACSRSNYRRLTRTYFQKTGLRWPSRQSWRPRQSSACFAASRILSARRRSDIKVTTYECGIPATPYNWSNINIRFYVFAILFLIFDVEAVFLFPWAVIFLDQKVLQANGVPFYAMLMFLGVLVFAIVYAWKKGALDWQR